MLVLKSLHTYSMHFKYSAGMKLFNTVKTKSV